MGITEDLQKNRYHIVFLFSSVLANEQGGIKAFIFSRRYYWYTLDDANCPLPNNSLEAIIYDVLPDYFKNKIDKLINGAT